MVKKYGPMSITGPPPSWNQDSGLGWKSWTPGKAKIKLPVRTCPMSLLSIKFLVSCPPPPKKVSGALPIYKLFFLLNLIILLHHQI